MVFITRRVIPLVTDHPRAIYRVTESAWPAFEGRGTLHTSPRTQKKSHGEGTEGPSPSISVYIRRRMTSVRLSRPMRLSHGHRPLPHPRETPVEREARDLIPSLPFAKDGFGEENARRTRIVLPWGVEQGMKEGNSFVPCSAFMGWLGHYQGVYIPRSNSMDIKFQLLCQQTHA